MSKKKVMFVSSTRLPTTYCPACMQIIDTATGASPDNSKPSPGAYGVCTKCYFIGIYNDAMQLTRPTNEQYDALKNSKEWEMTQLYIVMLRASKKR